MNNNIKVGIGFLIPASAIIFFIGSLYAEKFLLGAFISILGLLAWFLYSTIMQTSMPSVTGNIVILFGFLLSLAVFLSFGVRRNMFGGYEFIPEGGAASAILLLIIVLVGILFKQPSRTQTINKQLYPESLLDSELPNEEQSNNSDQQEYLFDDVGEKEYGEEEYEDYWDDEDYWDEEDYEE